MDKELPSQAKFSKREKSYDKQLILLRKEVKNYGKRTGN